MFNDDNSAASDDDVDEPQPQTLAEIFMEECVLALSFGMSYEQYWEKEPDLFYAYAKYYKHKAKSEFVEQDTLAWMIGNYVCIAVGVNMSAAFGEKGKPRQTYPNQPVFVTEMDETAKAKKQEQRLLVQQANFLAAAHNTGVTIEEAAS